MITAPPLFGRIITAMPDLIRLTVFVPNTCSFDTDCGSGSQCVKSEASIDGVCMCQQ